MPTFQALIDEVLSHQFSPAQYTTYIKGEIDASSGAVTSLGKINEAQRYVTSQTDFRELFTSTDVTTANADSGYTLPTDYQRVYSVYTVDSDGTQTPLEQISPAFYDEKGTTSTGKPSYYTMYGGEIKFWPVPDGVYTVRVRYFRDPANLVATNDEPEIPDTYHHLLVNYALWHCYERENDYNAAQYHKTRFDEDIMKCRGEVQYDIDDYAQPKQLGNNRNDILAPNVWIY